MKNDKKKNNKKWIALVALLLLLAVPVGTYFAKESSLPVDETGLTEIEATIPDQDVPLAAAPVDSDSNATTQLADPIVPTAPTPTVQAPAAIAPVVTETPVEQTPVEEAPVEEEPTVPSRPVTPPTQPEEPVEPETPPTQPEVPEEPAVISNAKTLYEKSLALLDAFRKCETEEERQALLEVTNNNMSNDAFRAKLAKETDGVWAALESEILAKTQNNQDSKLFVQVYMSGTNGFDFVPVIYAGVQEVNGASQQWKANLIYDPETETWNEYLKTHPYNGSTESYDVSSLRGEGKYEALKETMADSELWETVSSEESPNEDENPEESPNEDENPEESPSEDENPENDPIVEA